MISTVKRIIRAMADFKHIYQLARCIDTINRKIAKDKLQWDLTNEPHLKMLRYVKKPDAMSQFIEATGLTEPEAEDILETAIDKGYVVKVPENLPHRPDRLRLTPDKGKDLVYKIWFFKAGMWNEIIRHFNTFVTVALTVLIAGIIGNVDYVISFIRWLF